MKIDLDMAMKNKIMWIIPITVTLITVAYNMSCRLPINYQELNNRMLSFTFSELIFPPLAFIFVLINTCIIGYFCLKVVKNKLKYYKLYVIYIILCEIVMVISL